MTATLAAGDTAKAAAPAANLSATQSPASASLLDLYRGVWRYAAGRRRQYMTALALLSGASLARLTIPLLAGTAINTIQLGGQGSLARAGLCVAGVLLVYVLIWTLHGPGRVLERNVGLTVRANASDALYAKLMTLPLGWHEEHHSGEIQHRAQQYTQALYDFTQNQYIYLQAAINLVGPLVALTLLSQFTGAMALCGYVVLGFVIVRFDGVLMRLGRRENTADRRYAASMLDMLGNVSTLFSLRITQASRRIVGERLTKVFEPLRRNIVINEAKWCVVDLMGVTLSWTLVALYAWRAHGAEAAAAGTGSALLIGSVFMVYQYAQQASGVVSTMAANFHNIARARINLASADAIWQTESRVVSSAAIAPHWQRIEARGLSFSYPRDTRAGVRELSLALSRGERIALIGPSGSGKSTLLRLMAGLYEPQHGYYSVDGEPVFGARHLGSVATLVPQETEVFEASVQDNLTFGAEHAAAAIDHALYLSAFDSVVAALPQGLQTQLSERGFNLSGGQRQRLALARGLLAVQAETGRANSILLLDEPTGALDQATEARIFTRLRQHLPDTCLVAAVHRLSALEHFDRAVLMVDGAVVDAGTPQELSERQPLFRDLLRESAASEGTSPPLAAAR
jgi:ABC-type multidrug transport system fused ATPase/permease subunit